MLSAKVFLTFGMVSFAAACASEPPRLTEVDRISDEHFQIHGAGTVGVMVTGIGCGVTEREALMTARRIAHFNLRGVAGPRLKGVIYMVIREIPREGEFCVEVAAQQGA